MKTSFCDVCGKVCDSKVYNESPGKVIGFLLEEGTGDIVDKYVELNDICVECQKIIAHFIVELQKDSK